MEFPTQGNQCSFNTCKQLDSHQCSHWEIDKKNAEVCLKCSRMILIPQGKSNKEILEEHHSSICTLHLLSTSELLSKQQCKLIECTNNGDGSLVYVICDGCGNNFCLNGVSNSITKKKGNKKVELMLMKSKAQGNSSIPMTDRLYLLVNFPSDSNLASKPLFFNKDWSVGKVLDQIAIIGKINNNNNHISMNDPKIGVNKQKIKFNLRIKQKIRKCC
ncbi:1931_t:CDS:2 [Entrophospora sp. SA101]|nr:9330_t:CDS:2 [Entrophospora sp. SA101]CAJ0923115.1 1931_t:CDS:2 [Entrophospora sp. SA101]